jgi:hypothetical protein
MAKDLNRPSLRARVALISCVLVSGFGVAMLDLTVARAHEPITTKVRFNKEVVRILQRNCLGCHRPGGIAMSLATYDEARPWAKAIKEELLEKRMPPWHPVKGYGEFRNAPTLSQRDIDLVINWVEGGAPKGDEKDLPEGPLYSTDWQLGKPDLTLKADSESKIAADADERRTVVLATNLKEDRWVSAIDLKPGNGSVVHCAKLYLVQAGDGPAAPMTPDAPAVDLRNASLLTTWMPGQKRMAWDEGTGQLLPAGARIAVSVHYHGSGEPATDLTTIGFYFSKTTPRKKIQEVSINNPDAVIPVTSEYSPLRISLKTKTDMEAVAIRPRVNPLLVSLQATARRPDGTEEVLIWARRYQFDWEPIYYFLRPVVLPAGTQIDVVAYFDNSDDNPKNPNDPPKAVRWSDLSSDPLCSLLVTNNTVPAQSTTR